MKNFLPERYQYYVTKNIKMSPLVRKYDGNLPVFLQRRPKWLIDLVTVQLEAIPAEKDINVKNLLEDGIFQVQSLTHGSRFYTVHIDERQRKCNCTCIGFKKQRIVCKHIIVVGVKFPELHLSKIHSWAMGNPIFWIDDEVSVLEKTEMPSATFFIDATENREETTYKDLPSRGGAPKDNW